MRTQASDKSLLLVSALALWLVSVLCHDWGTVLARTYFTWASEPGVLHEAGGTAGFMYGEYLLAAALCLPALCLAAWASWGMMRLSGEALRQRLALWGPSVLVWAALSYIAWKSFIAFASELVHFGQYALIGGLLALALGDGRRQAAFLLGVGLGCIDEVWQHYVLHRWWLGEETHWLDWSDMALNALGACGGILFWAVRAPAGGREERPRLVWLATAAVAVLLLPLLLLDPVNQTRLWGSYPTYPVWNEYANHKPVYWPQPRQGIPIFLAVVLVLGTLLRPRRRRGEVAVLAAVCLLGALALDPPSRRAGQLVHAEVPSVRVPYIGAAGAPAIDGVLDDKAWAAAVRLGPFVNGPDGRDHVAYTEKGIEKRQALQDTYVRLLWDDEAFYAAFEVSDRDVWVRDDELENLDECVAVFLDDGGDEVTYYAFNVDAANQVYDYFTFVPAAPVDFNPWNKHTGLPHWEARGLRTAVRVDGTLEWTESWPSRPALDVDRGYTVEMAIPWENFRTTNTPGDQTIRRTVQPQPGERWRLGLFRLEYPRLTAEELAAVERDTEVDEAAGRALLGTRAWDTLVRYDRLRLAKGKSGYNVRDLRWQTMVSRQERQAWAPVYNTSLHKPTRFGVVEFVGPETAP